LGTLSRYNIAASGNKTRAIIPYGNDDTNLLASTGKYTYSGDTTAAGTSLSLARRSVTGCSSLTDCYFSGGATTITILLYSAPTTTVDKYTMATDTNAATTSIPAAIAGAQASNNDTKGIVAGGSDGSGTQQTATSKRTFSTDSVTTGGTLSAARTFCSAPSCNNAL